MIHATFKQKLDASGNIPGIYNYCNRFCEDCPFTDVCATYKMSASRFLQTENPDDFGRAIKETLEESKRFIEEMIEESGLDLSEIKEDPTERAWRAKIDEAVVSHHLAKKSEILFEMMDNFFRHADSGENNPDVIEITELEIQKLISFSLHIHTKMNRALHGFYEMNPLSEDDFDAFDMNGSAKCILVMLDDSIDLYEKLIKFNPQFEDKVSNITSHLKSLRAETEIQFPDAMAFIRGGFDEM